MSKQSTISYSPSIYKEGSFEVLSCGLLVGTIDKAGTNFVARPHRHRHAEFSTIEGAVGYFSNCFPLGAQTAEILGNKIDNQIKLLL